MSGSGSPAWALLLAPATIRTRCGAVAAAVASNRSMHWRLDEGQALADAGESLLQAWQAQGGRAAQEVPPWNADAVDRDAQLRAALSALPAAEQARACIDLRIVLAVAQSAGAPPAPWCFVDEAAGAAAPRALARIALPAARHGTDDLLAMLNEASATAPATAPAPAAATEPAADAVPEADAAATAAAAATATATATATAAAAAVQPAGLSKLSGRNGLAVALLRAFMAGAFSADPQQPCRADPSVLRELDATALRALLQSTPINPVPGLEAMAQRLGRITRRPGGLLDDWLAGSAAGRPCSATQMLADVLALAGPACGGARIVGASLGDVFSHLWAGGRGLTADWVPLHSAVQDLVRGLAAHPLLAAAGLVVTELELLTASATLGLVGFFVVEHKVILPRDERDLRRPWAAGDPGVQEARALALHLMHGLAHRLGAQTGGATAAALQSLAPVRQARRPFALLQPAVG